MKITRAVVAAPPVRDFYFTPGRASALGAEAVRNQLERKGVSTTLFNYPLHNPRGKQISLDSFYDYLKPYIIPGEKSPIGFFSGRKIYGPSFDDAAAMILDSDPQVIFLSLFAWTYADDVLALAKSIKRQNGNSIPLILGGAGAAVLPEYFRRTGLFDAVLKGDAEDTIIPVLKKLENEVYDFSDLSEEISCEPPEPALSFRTDSEGNQYLTLSLSRGCPKRCQFCSNFLTQGRLFRTASLESLEERLNRLPIDAGREVNINLEDDNLLVDKSYLNDVLVRIALLYPERKITMMNGLDYTYMNEDYADYLIDEGFSHFSLSLGSTDAAVLKAEKRPVNLERLEKLLLHLKTRQVPSTTFFICGLPDDSQEGIIESLLYLHRLPTETGISLFYPVPGLPRFEDDERFLSKPPSLCSGSSAYPWANSLTTSEMVTAFRLARLSNLIKKKGKTKVEHELINRIMTSGQLHTTIGRKRELTLIPHMDQSMVDLFIKSLAD